MRNFTFLLISFLVFCAKSGIAQNTLSKNAVHAKININDFSLLNDADLKLGQSFDFGLFRNIAPFLNVGVPLRVGVGKLIDKPDNTVITSIDAVFHLINMKSEAKVVPYALLGGGYFMEKFNNGHFQLPLGAGLNYKISPYAYINVQAEYRKAFTDLRDNLHFGAGFVYLLHKGTPKIKDRDKDGVPDNLDKCPDTPGKSTANGCPDADNDGIGDKEDECPNEPGPVETGGCPDTDFDGVRDKEDKCPQDAGTVNGCPDADGDEIPDNMDRCPTKAGPASNDGCPVAKDSDGDGFPDETDQCPTTSGTANGCPDADKDGVADNDDKCPNEAGTKANMGCPQTQDSDGDGLDDNADECPTLAGKLNGCPDSDNDGVADKNDPCPNAAGKFNGCPDTDGDGVADNLDKCPNTVGPTTNFGCPEVKKETKERLEFAMKAVQFETGRAVLKMESYAILDEVNGILRQYPDYKLAVSGHTDDIGDAPANQTLSEARAKACYDYFIFRGVKTERIRYAGFGEDRPIASNGTKTGREMNRRVEFELILD